MNGQQSSIVLEATIMAYVRRYHCGRDASAMLTAIVERFGGATGWSEARVAELMAQFALLRGPKAATPAQAKGQDREMKAFVAEFVDAPVTSAEIHAKVVERFGFDRTPSVSTIGAIIREGRRIAMLSPKRRKAASRRAR